MALAGAADTPLGRRIGPDRLRYLVIVALLLQLVVADRQETALLFLSEDFRASLHTTETNLILESHKVVGIPAMSNAKPS